MVLGRFGNQLWIAAAMTLALSMTAYAGNVHTWHLIKADNGVWDGTLSSINEHASFVTPKGMSLNHFMLTSDSPVTYGFQFEPGDDFNVAYTLTLTEKSEVRFSSKACVFVVSALRPGVPDIRVLNYHGAKCEILRQGERGSFDYRVA